ncbi:MAG: 30S ribosomal protein S12 methylthiotransferase RimO [Kiritimatiellae bacterium]|nr:30S ribosomal protein S12 methylthiotransferase RimO [Kiritimatiellia bacterium]
MSVSVGFISLGCAKNLVDSQIMAGYLKSGAVELAAAPESADIILINTCAFIDLAREEATETILSACAHKANGDCRAVIVTGCMVQRYRERLAEVFPEVDGFLGVDELDQIVPLVEQVAAGKSQVLMAAAGAAHRNFDPLYPTLLFTGGPFAYLKISDGCNHRCAYCAIPEIRGNFRSRSDRAILEEARRMVEAGVREINVISQDTLNYGADSLELPSIESLLQQIDQIEGDFRVRLLYSYPSSVTPELLELLNTSRHICKYLDLPVQHSHPEILRAMNRAAAVDATQDLTARLRAAVPGIVLRTTCLVGFPGESEAHFEHLLQYVKRSEFDHLGVFVYSPEEDTAAFGMEDLPDLEVAEERCERLMALQAQIVEKKLRLLIGREDELLLLRQEGELWYGRLPRQAPDVDGETMVAGLPATARVGDRVLVTITGFDEYDLEAAFLG